MLDLNKSYCMDCLDGMKQLDDNSIDSIVTDPPYFLISKSGSGFMGKRWDSLSTDNAYNILCRSDEFARIAEKFFMLLRVEPNGAEANFVQGSASTKVRNSRTDLKSSVPFVENGLNDIKAKSKASSSFAHGLVLTKEEVLDMLREISPSHMSAIESQNGNVLFAIPYLHITKLLRNIVPENVLKLPIEKICGEKEIQVILTDEVRIKSATEGMIGSILEDKFMKEIDIDAEHAENNVIDMRYRHIISSHTNKQKIIRWIILLLFAINAIGRWRGNQSLFLMYHFHRNWARESFRVLKPGGHMLVFGGTRTYHRMVCGVEDAGFEIRDCIQWLYGSGFPKSLNIGKQIDKLNGKRQDEFIALGNYLKEKRGDIPQNQISKLFPSKTGGLTGCVSNWELGYNVPTKEQWIILKRELTLDDKFDYLIDRIEAEREVIGKHQQPAKEIYQSGELSKELTITAPATPEAKQWNGWGTALKPANEPIVVARKPLSEKTVALNVLKWGTGGINIDECKINYSNIDDSRIGKEYFHKAKAGLEIGNNKDNKSGKTQILHNTQGRFPANIILDEEAGEMLDEQSGTLKSGKLTGKEPSNTTRDIYGKFSKRSLKTVGDKGGASRFFYCAKASKSERNMGCEGLEKKVVAYGNQQTAQLKRGEELTPNAGVGDGGVIAPQRNNHPTVKPIKLMEYLVKLVTPPNGIVLDPFIGSGTTGLACKLLNRKYIGFENNADYFKIAQARLSADISKYKRYVDKKLIKDDESEESIPEKDYLTQLDDWIDK